jgi:hypothetical protein
VNTKKMKEAWQTLRRGDHNSTQELQAMRRQIVEALPLLNAHPDAGAMRRVALTDLTNIEGYLEARRRGNRSLRH